MTWQPSIFSPEFREKRRAKTREMSCRLIYNSGGAGWQNLGVCECVPLPAPADDSKSLRVRRSSFTFGGLPFRVDEIVLGYSTIIFVRLICGSVALLLLACVISAAENLLCLELFGFALSLLVSLRPVF